MFCIAYTFKAQVHVLAGQVKTVSHSSCRTSAILKYFCPLSRSNYELAGGIQIHDILDVSPALYCAIVLIILDSQSSSVRAFILTSNEDIVCKSLKGCFQVERQNNFNSLFSIVNFFSRENSFGMALSYIEA